MFKRVYDKVKDKRRNTHSRALSNPIKRTENEPIDTHCMTNSVFKDISYDLSNPVNRLFNHTKDESLRKSNFSNKIANQASTFYKLDAIRTSNLDKTHTEISQIQDLHAKMEQDMALKNKVAFKSNRSTVSKDKLRSIKNNEIGHLKTEPTNNSSRFISNTDQYFYKPDADGEHMSINLDKDSVSESHKEINNEDCYQGNPLAGMTTTGNFFNSHNNLSVGSKYGNETKNSKSVDKFRKRRNRSHVKRFINMEHKLLDLDGHIDNIMQSKKIQFKYKMENLMYDTDKQNLTRQLRKI